MNDRPSRIGQLLAELRRRHVVRALLGYTALAFVVLQVAEIITDAFELPSSVLRLVVVLSLLGFPLVLVLAWVYEITPHGIRTMRELDAEAGIEERPDLVPRLIFAGVTVLAVVSAGLWWVRSTVADATGSTASETPAFRAASATDVDQVHSIAVLPLESFAEAGGTDYFAQGMQEALISQLSQLGFVRVMSRTSVNQYDAAGKSVVQIGDELGVDALVEGSVLSDGERVRITVQLIHAATDQHLWSADYERDLVDVIALQREVASAIAQAIRGELEPLAAESPVEAVAHRADPEAAEAFMKGRVALFDAAEGSVDFDQVEANFERAISEDPQFSAAYSGLAQTYLFRGLSSGGQMTLESLGDAARAASTAIRLDPANREAHETLAQIGMLGREGPLIPAPPGDSAGVGIHLAGLDSMGLVMGEGFTFVPALTEMGRQLQVVVAAREAREGVPDVRVRAARRLEWAGRHDRAYDILREIVSEEPQSREAWDELEHILVVRGDVQGLVELREDREQRLGGGPPGAPTAADLAAAVDQAGLEGYWAWRLRDLEARQAAGETVSAVDEAACFAALGREDEAYAALERAVANRDPHLASLRGDPVWDDYRRDERFREILGELSRIRVGPRPPRRPGGER